MLHMETGIKAWLANQDGKPARVELPGGWEWDVQQGGTGCLLGPGGSRCVGYDLNKGTIRFGADGETKATGLNLWTVQDVGEKFARENFMDEATASAYDQFAKERGDRRREYEKNTRAEMTGLIQVELIEGKWTAHADADAIRSMTGIDTAPELSRQQGIALFNRMSEAMHVMPLRDPMGYMTLDGNLYDYMKDQYEFQYEDTIQNIDAGFINGNGRGCEAVLDKLDATVRKNIREYCLPEGVNYQDIRHVAVTPDLKNAANEFVRQRVTKTVDFERKRSHSPESLARDHAKFLAAGEALKEQISIAALPPLDVSMGQESGMNI